MSGFAPPLAIHDATRYQTVQDPFWEGKEGARRGGKERKGRRGGDREKEDAHWRVSVCIRIEI